MKIRLFPFDSCLLDFVSVTLAMHVTLTLPDASGKPFFENNFWPDKTIPLLLHFKLLLLQLFYLARHEDITFRIT